VSTLHFALNDHDSFGIFIKFWIANFISKGFVIQKQVKINAGKIERRFGVVMTPFSSSKMIQINCQE